LQVLGDRSLKYNYLNPNLLFVATGTPPADAARMSPEQQQVSITLLNTVTGGVLHQQLHSGCAGPVHAVVSQNWVVYALRDVVALRQQVRHGLKMAARDTYCTFCASSALLSVSS
jgi:hypothetical protein